MRCKSCDYPLWQIRDRKCPECGANFKPSDFEFVLNSVRFCCPHCAQAYYGTGAKGHLIPNAFDCVSCSRHISMDEMVLLPTEGVREDQTKVEVNPWLERRRKGIVKGWFSTVIQSMGTPSRLIRATPEQSSLMQAVWYAAVTNGLFLLGGLSVLLVLMAVVGIIGSFAGGGGMGGGGVTAVMAPIAVFIGWAIGMVIAMICGAFVWGAIAHGLLRLTGPTSAGIGRTMQCVLYSSGTNVANAVPCLGFYIGWISSIWWTISATLMIKEAQRVSGGRAALATILPVVLGLILIVGLFVFAVVMPISTTIATAQAAAVQAQATQAATGDTGRIAQIAAAIRTHVDEYGELPSHGIELVGSQRVWVSAYLQPEVVTSTRLETSKVVGVTLADLGRADGETTDRIIAAAGASLPENVIAHRVGDTVFCYHGIDLSSASPRLWLVFASDDLDATASHSVTVGCVDGSTPIIPIEDFPISLSHQNALRADAGLAPLPDPSTITAEKPAVEE